MDALKEEKLWTGTDVSKGVDRVKRELSRNEEQQLKYLHDLITSKEWNWGSEAPAQFTEFHNPSHRDFESPFEVFDPQSLGSLLYYDSMWVQMDDEGVAMEQQLDVDLALFFVPLARGTWRCTWPGRLLGSDGQAEWVLKGNMRPLQSFKAHERGITSITTIAKSTGGTRELLATISEGVEAKIWDVQGMRCSVILVGHRERITCITYAANLVFTGSTDCTVRKWVLNQRGSCTAVLNGHTDSITALTADKHASWLLSGSRDGSVRVWHVLTGTCVAILGGGKSAMGGSSSVFPRCLVLDEGHSYVYSGLHNGEVQVWDLHQYIVPIKRPGTVLRTKPKSSSHVRSVMAHSRALWRSPYSAICSLHSAGLPFTLKLKPSGCFM